MKTKFFMTGLAIVAASICVSCGNSTERKLKEIRKGVDELETQMKSRPVPDDKLLINSVLYQISDTRKIYNHRGMETDVPDFGRDHITHMRILFPKETGGFEVGYLVKTTRGISLQANKTFYFYNKLGLTGDIVDIYSVAGMILSDGTFIPVRITVKGKDNPIMWQCKDTDVLTFEPLVRIDFRLSYTVKELKDYCNKNGIKYDAVPYLQFTD
ncbi:hypothetical protein QVN91_12845 [Bacteroides caecigallinarum]|mgnify:CR=1 FL=1|uniref:hypothetical protein n=1 Tax=uncultured Bacteroides sp. TaxID=162156 RepID=UPI0025941321|nr:hypothetical protein [uncultured Bacteroides sp.]MDN0053826.1 hypothetical protein [Bacteroides caecigallinarum]